MTTMPSRMIGLGMPQEVAQGYSNHNEPFRNPAFVWDLNDEVQGLFWDGDGFRQRIRNRLRSKDNYPLVTEREGSCPQQDCPLREAM